MRRKTSNVNPAAAGFKLGQPSLLRTRTKYLLRAVLLVLVSACDLVVMAATLANHGVNPITGARVRMRATASMS